MFSRHLKKTPCYTISGGVTGGVILVLSLVLSYVPHHLTLPSLKAEPLGEITISPAERSSPLIIYYSRTGKTRMAALAIKDHLSCECEELKTKTDRTGWGIITCVLDQLLDRDAEFTPLNHPVKDYNPLILASPIWLGKLSSPVRSFIKQNNLKDKEVYVVITYNGSLSGEKEYNLRKELGSSGMKLKGIYKIVSKNKTEEDIKKDIIEQLKEKPIVVKEEVTSTAMVI